MTQKHPSEIQGNTWYDPIQISQGQGGEILQQSGKGLATGVRLDQNSNPSPPITQPA